MEDEIYYQLHAETSNLNCIENNLWLGNLAAASDVALLIEKNVKRIVTVNSFPLPKEVRDLDFIENKYIEVEDTPEDDLLSHFDETYQFIENGLRNGAVLVHCYFGISRSATIIVSYCMKKHRITVEQALRYVQSKREAIAPNPGFLEQLKLYELMNYTLNKSNIRYKIFRLRMASYYMGRKNIIPDYYADVIQSDPLELTTADPVVFKCRKCRRIVAYGSNEIPHLPNLSTDWTDWNNWSKTEICLLTYFIEPFVWMKNVKSSFEGKIHCPNTLCGSKLGSFNWLSGCQCACGTVVYPGFYLIPSKVDRECSL